MIPLQKWPNGNNFKLLIRVVYIFPLELARKT